MQNETSFTNPVDSQLSASSIKVAMAEDSELTIKGVSAAINDAPGVTLCRSFLNGQELLDWYDGSNADIILLDIYMPVLDGIETSKQLLSRFPDVKIIILSARYYAPLVFALKKTGICAFLTKNVRPDELIQTILKVSAGEKTFPENTHSVDNSDISNFSQWELAILRLIVKGKTNAEIAEELYLSPLTVKIHQQNLMNKLEAHDTQQLVSYAVLKGLVK